MAANTAGCRAHREAVQRRVPVTRPVVLMNRAGFYKAGWIEKHWPTLPQRAEIRMTGLESGPDLHTEVAEADILYNRGSFRLTRDILEAGRKLRGVVTSGVGTEKIDVAAATELGIPVANSPGNTSTVAEAAMLLVAALAKRLHFWIEAAREGKVPDSTTEGMELFNKTIGLIGYGRIGRATGKIAQAYEMHVLAYDPYVTESDVAELVSLEELLKRSDFVSLHTLLNDDKRRIINEENLDLMKSTAFLINTSRGELVDEEALERALTNGGIAGAGLDVWDIEPVSPDHPLLGLPNVIGTPHGLAHASESRRRCAVLSEQSILSLLDGNIPEFTVNPTVTWRFDQRTDRRRGEKEL